MNRSKHARHRSIKKGQKNQLATVLDELKKKATSYKEYTGFSPRVELDNDWGAGFFQMCPTAYGSVPEYIGKGGKFKIEKIPAPLQAGAQRAWFDAVEIITTGWYGGGNVRGVIAVAYSNDFFDIIVSKWGRGNDLKHNHHFYHWHVKAKDGKLKSHPVVYVDDVNTDSLDVTPPGNTKLSDQEMLDNVFGSF